MKIIITKTFKEDFFHIFKSKLALDFFISKIHNGDLISLNSKYKKYKFDIGNISIRGVVYLESEKLIYLPIFITKKSDKKYGMNLILEKDFLEILNNKMIKSTRDINNGDYETF